MTPTNVEHLKSYAVRWNNLYPLDRWYRRKYNIGFGTAAHRELCQINILLEYMEEVLFRESEALHLNGIENEKELKDGIWIKERINTAEEDELFVGLSNIDLTTIQY
ncbi:hypothetical protein [Chitinophaga arvensicola]|uniref:Uncharacterized protein n=1 Tax=Chitinophaga arvensicola TaxID=29529 RepID=A0A1I0R9Q0_9BACT|nr:hypothetical protein [Chitinophaga arvensicola]SEW37434.1 hypothetical protein SAMN04488122_2506 [Chitinophaga arvensicola]